MTWLQFLVGFTFLLTLAWVEMTERQRRNPYRRSRREQIEQIQQRRMTSR